MNIVPTLLMTVLMTSPQSRWKPPLAETLAMSDALLMYYPRFLCWVGESQLTLCLSVLVFWSSCGCGVEVFLLWLGWFSVWFCCLGFFAVWVWLWGAVLFAHVDVGWMLGLWIVVVGGCWFWCFVLGGGCFFDT